MASNDNVEIRSRGSSVICNSKSSLHCEILLEIAKDRKNYIISDAIPRYFTIVEPNDVLLGRGAPIINNEGNVRFRKIVAERKQEYRASCRHQLKNKVAQDIIDEIVQKKNGRFLHMVDDIEELKETGHIPKDAKSAWTLADSMVIIQKVKQALRELEETSMSTCTSSTEKKRKKLNYSPTTSQIVSSASKRKRKEGNEEDINIFIEYSEDSNSEKPIKALDEANKNTISIKSKVPPSRTLQTHGKRDELDSADFITNLTFALNEEDDYHNIQLESFHQMPPINKNDHNEPNGMNHEQKSQHLVRLDIPTVTNLRERMILQEPIQETQRIEQLTQQQNLHNQISMRQSGFFHGELIQDQLNDPLHAQNQHMVSTVDEDSITNIDMQPLHEIDNFQRKISFLPNQSREMMALKQEAPTDQYRFLLRRKRLLYALEEQQRNIMLLQCQLQQQQHQHQLLELDHRNNSQQELMGNTSTLYQDVAPILNTTFLESNVSLNNPLQQSPAYQNNILDSYEMVEPIEINDLNQYQMQLDQQQHLSNMFPSEYVPYSCSTKEMRDGNEINDVIPIEFENLSYINNEKHYQNSHLHNFQLPDSADDRKMITSIETNVTDPYRNQDAIQSLRTNNEVDEIDDDEFAALKNFFERKNELAVAGYLTKYKKPCYHDSRGQTWYE